ncbi:hypothetical protein [Paenibacillus xylanexedens]|nr:hypothetical protein [Paenibacillus xylanexedens]
MNSITTLAHESVSVTGTDFYFAYFQINYFTCRSKHDILQLLRQME